MCPNRLDPASSESEDTDKQDIRACIMYRIYIQCRTRLCQPKGGFAHTDAMLKRHKHTVTALQPLTTGKAVESESIWRNVPQLQRITMRSSLMSEPVDFLRSGVTLLY